VDRDAKRGKIRIIKSRDKEERKGVGWDRSGDLEVTHAIRRIKQVD
jgi:hypothetical protein